jgi:putative ABC transport system permease protein
MRSSHRLDQLAQDGGFAIRNLRRQPGFALAAILTLAFGIGATTAILSVVNGVMIRPLPYPNSARLGLVFTTGRRGTAMAGRPFPFSAANFIDVRRETRTIEHLAAFRNWGYTLAENGEAELLSGAKVSPGLFEALGTRPALGRSFEPSDESTGAEPVAILGDALWRRRFGADRSVLGRPVTLNGQQFTIVGVMPPAFGFPRGAELPSGLQFGARTEVWTPLSFTESELQFRSLQNLAVIALPKPNVSIETAERDLETVMGRLEVQYPGPNRDTSAKIDPLLESAVHAVRPALVVLLGAVGFLLLIACVNVSNLLLTRTAARSREVAVRAALGAGRRRLWLQFVTENAILVAIGGVIGIAVAAIGKSALLALAPANLPRRADITLDWRVLASAIGLMIAIGAAFGTLVAAEAASGNRVDRLREGVKSSGGRAGRRLRHGLVIVEVAVSVMLLSGAGILGRTFQNLRSQEPGFRTQDLLTLQASLPRTTSDFRQFAKLLPAWNRFYERLVAELERTPGIRDVAAATMLPLTGAWESTGFTIVGRPPQDSDRNLHALYTGVSDAYFRTMGIPVIKGRTFDATDRNSSAATVVISQAMAKAFWPGQDPLGQQLNVFFGRPLEIVGIVGDVRHRGLSADPIPSMYFPMSLYASPNMMIAARTVGEPLSGLPAVRSSLRSIDPTVPLTAIQSMDQVMAESMAQQRMSALLIGIFALAALLLAVLGLYGVISFGVARRAREIGIRLALGARPSSVLGQVIWEGTAMSLTGVALGVVGAIALGRLLTTLVYGVSPTDPATLFGVSAVLVVVTLLASLVPARRAMRVDPVTALRQE